MPWVGKRAEVEARNEGVGRSINPSAAFAVRLQKSNPVPSMGWRDKGQEVK